MEGPLGYDEACEQGSKIAELVVAGHRPPRPPSTGFWGAADWLEGSAELSERPLRRERSEAGSESQDDVTQVPALVRKVRNGS